MKLYRVDIKICGTAYIAADNPARAKIVFNETFREGEFYMHNTDGDLIVDTDFEELIAEGESATMSPAITFYGTFLPGEELEEVD